MAPEVFVDTAGWLALFNLKDALHTQAQSVRNTLRQQRVRLVTTQFVLIEVADAFTMPLLRPLAFTFFNGLRQTDAIWAVEVIPVSEELLAKGWTLYSQRLDKEWV